jgi:hypothetical protein
MALKLGERLKIKTVEGGDESRGTQEEDSAGEALQQQ